MCRAEIRTNFWKSAINYTKSTNCCVLTHCEQRNVEFSVFGKVVTGGAEVYIFGNLC